MPVCSNSACQIAWRDVRAVQFFLFPSESSAAEWQLTKTLNDFEKRFIAGRGITYARIRDETVRVRVETSEQIDRSEVLAGIEEAFGQTIKIKMPVYLLSDREKLFLEIDKISVWNGVRIEDRVEEDETVLVSGTYAQVYRARTDLYKMVENFQGREALVVNAYVNGRKIVEAGGRVYFETKIRGARALVSGVSIDEMVSAKDEVAARHSTKVLINAIKFSYSMVYFRADLEDILVRHDVYIAEINTSDDWAEMELVGLVLDGLAEAAAEIEMLYTSIITVCIEKTDPHSGARVFMLQMDKQEVLIGKRAEIKKMLREVDIPCELHIDISAYIEEFICGKKNGKINKVARESQTTVGIHKESAPSLFIQGGSRNVEFALALVEDELPAEYSFYLHEKHHKRIIGYGGKTIQRLMKKHGVYIKFDSSANHQHNVVIRTPKKNQESLLKMHKDVVELAGEPTDHLQGMWKVLSYWDFYAASFSRFVLESTGVKVFTNNPLEIRYFLVPNSKEMAKYKVVCSIENSLVVASFEPIFDGQLITGGLWKKENALSTHFSKEYGEPLFSKELLWSKKWRKTFADMWQGSSWPKNGFSKM
ncbi:hypothetical protein NEHOM01_1848 [Nematocida homosporus]|uniref:uncharacterized protein n=1 Tax=Nematocida homosporus TaxID=1912981 RepID=UPI00221F787F|nr:uncharacterized protein NEHOM01_1848 [Nematocida homosporus]KAI5186990.1 hypothetical protein NEHOM01_1848 [Nematocida homosporus]